MSRLSLLRPVAPHVVNRAWGVRDALYEQYGFERHNGIDLDLVEGQEIVSPMDAKVTLIRYQPRGSGTFLCLLSDETYEFDDGRVARVELTFMHLKETCVLEGMRVRAGDVIALGGRSGQTTGSHLHLAPKRVKRGLIGYRDIDRNDANNTFDPAPYFVTDTKNAP